MMGPMNKGSSTPQVSTQPQPGMPQPGASGPPSGKGDGSAMAMPGGLAALFANNQPTQAGAPPVQVPQIAAPQYGPSLMPTTDQAMEATRARMLARTPPPPVVADPAAAPPQTAWERMRSGRNGGSR